MTNLKTLKQQTADMEAKLNEMKVKIERLKIGWVMEPDFEDDDEYYYLTDIGEINKDYWAYLYEDGERFDFGNIFKTLQEAELEEKRRKLLTRFRAFRDECNGNWKPDFTICDNKYFIEKRSGKIAVNYLCNVNAFMLFGYFKNYEDAKRAIELFGQEIKELFVECE